MDFLIRLVAYVSGTLGAYTGGQEPCARSFRARLPEKLSHFAGVESQLDQTDGEPHCSGNSFRGKALPVRESGRAKNQSSYSGMGIPFSVKIVSSS